MRCGKAKFILKFLFDIYNITLIKPFFFLSIIVFDNQWFTNFTHEILKKIACQLRFAHGKFLHENTPEWAVETLFITF
jgi:hypothetical protein